MSAKARWLDALAPREQEEREQEERELTRSERLALFHAACAALAEGKTPPAPAAIFLGTAGLAWLQGGGSLEADHLRLTAPRGSHVTPTTLWHRLIGDEDF